VAFVLGLVASALRLPPLVGYLGGGLALYGFGATGTELLHEIGHIGVLLLLFTVGLHLRLKNVLRPEIFGAGVAQLAISAVLFAAIGVALGLDPVAAVVIAVVLGFSSTVLAAKTLEGKSELEAYHGRTAIGILILQDIVAILVLAFSGLEAPSLWAPLLLLLPLARPLILRLLVASEHDELQLLYGLLLALGGGGLFALLGISSELGALAAGVLLAGHPKADELGEKLWGLKEAFLVAFFLEIGLGGLPPVEGVLLALAILLFLPFRAAIYFLLMTLLFKHRARTGFMLGASLTSYSEFALIAGVPAAAAGLIPQTAILVLALVVVLSFVVGAPVGDRANALYAHLEPALKRFERKGRHPDQTPQVAGSARSLVFGMGRIGTAAYDTLLKQDKRPLGFDSDPAKIERHLREGRRVVYGEAEDPDVWRTQGLAKMEMAVLALPEFEARLRAIEALRERGFDGVISAISMFPEEEEPLRKAGADVISHPLTEAGFGLAEQSLRLGARSSAT
jgi:predicted Kef-type K+ transport protein